MFTDLFALLADTLDCKTRREGAEMPRLIDPAPIPSSDDRLPIVAHRRCTAVREAGRGEGPRHEPEAMTRLAPHAAPQKSTRMTPFRVRGAPTLTPSEPRLPVG
jgi:hypothetical protein